MAYILLLGSKSQPRQELLADALIPFKVVSQDADEAACDWGLSLPQVVENIALHKMNHVILPEGSDGDICFVLTADTLSQDHDGKIQGKPIDKNDAIEKIKNARQGSRLCSAFCLDRRVYKDNAWHVQKRIQQVVSAQYHFFIPDEWIETYLNNSIGLACSNAIAVDKFGMQFLKNVQGSYSNIIGLPMFELRQALTEIGFYF